MEGSSVLPRTLGVSRYVQTIVGVDGNRPENAIEPDGQHRRDLQDNCCSASVGSMTL